VRTSVFEQRLGGIAIELRRRLVEQQQLRSSASGCETHALQFAAGQLGDRALGDAPRRSPTVQTSRARRSHRSSAEVPRPNATSASTRQHYLGRGFLEHGRHGPGKVRGTQRSRVAPGDDDAAGEPAAVKVRHEARKRAEQRRLAGPRRSEQRDEFATFDLEGHACEGGSVGAGIREAQVDHRR
jgi:hypothetical protein